MAEFLEAVLLQRPEWFTLRINEAVTWAVDSLNKAPVVEISREELWRGQPSLQLRTDALDPAAFGAETFGQGRRNIPTTTSVETLASRRAELLQGLSMREQVPADAGRLLLFTPQDSLSDGCFRWILRCRQCPGVGYMAVF